MGVGDAEDNDIREMDWLGISLDKKEGLPVELMILTTMMVC